VGYGIFSFTREKAENSQIKAPVSLKLKNDAKIAGKLPGKFALIFKRIFYEIRGFSGIFMALPAKVVTPGNFPG